VTLRAVYVFSLTKKIASNLTSSAAIAERPRCRVGKFWPKVEDDIPQKYMSIFNHCDVIACKAIEFGEIKQNKGYYAVQGHSRSPMSVPIERPYATSY